MELSGRRGPLVPGRRWPARWRTRPNVRVAFAGRSWRSITAAILTTPGRCGARHGKKRTKGTW